MDLHHLGMKEVVGDFTGRQLGAIFFRGSEPIDTIWATSNLEVALACIMPVGYRVGGHRLFVVDFSTASMIGTCPPKIICPALRVQPGAAKKHPPPPTPGAHDTRGRI
jgi:hypothetical protein